MYKCTPSGLASLRFLGGVQTESSSLAIYHLRLKVISRSLGRAAKPGGATRRSIVAAAAYRSGDRLFDLSQGKWFAYEKPDVVHTEILAPEGAPAWVFDRSALWNMADRAEKREDAQLAREVELTLPRELTKPQQVALVRSFVQERFVRMGMVADVGIHRPDAADGLEQPHAHVLLTMRRLDPRSETGFSARKERDWNEREDIARAVAEARKAFNNTPTPAAKAALEATEALRNVNVWRAAWAEHANRALHEAGSEARIDHRTLEAQGIARKPQNNLGVARHIEKAYGYIRERVTQWVSLKKRAELYEELEHYKQRDPSKIAELMDRLSEIAEEIAASFRHGPDEDLPEVPIER